MLVFLIPLLLATSATSLDYQPLKSAATAAQIRFAIENKYDDTGPGAKGPEYAYNTYKTLEDALIGYLDDPNTKLPDHEREKALKKLYKSNAYMGRLYGQDQFFKQFRVNNFQGKHIFPERPILQTNEVGTKMNIYKVDPYTWHKVKTVKSSPMNLAHYMKDPQTYDPSPQYSYSYGVHDKQTGDLKSAHESRDGYGTVLGYYTFLDPDGRQRTVNYHADDTRGFMATVRREFEGPQ